MNVISKTIKKKMAQVAITLVIFERTPKIVYILKLFLANKYLICPHATQNIYSTIQAPVYQIPS